MGSASPELQLKALIEHINQEAMSDDLNRAEVQRVIEYFKKGGTADQLEQVLKAYDRGTWLLRILGMFLLAGPAVAVVASGFSKIVEWIKSH